MQDRRSEGGSASSLLERVTSSSDSPQQSAPRSAQELHILRSGLECFATSGYTATTVRHIAAAAGVTGAMVNYYFGSKEALYAEIAELIFDALAERVDRAFDAPPRCWRERLHRMCYSYVDFAAESRSASQFLIDAIYGIRGGRPDLDCKRLHARMEARFHALFAEAIADGSLVLRDGCSASDGAELVFMAIEYAALRWLKFDADSGVAAKPLLRSRLDRLLRVAIVGFDARQRITACDADGTYRISRSRTKRRSR